MNILFHIGEMSRGGAERVVANLANYFAEHEHEVMIVTDSSAASGYELAPTVQIRTLDKHDPSSNIIIRTYTRVKQLRAIIKEFQPDVTVGFLNEPIVRLLLANFFSHRKTIVSVRNNPADTFSGIADKLILKFLYPRADGIVFQTKDMQKYFSKKLQKKSVVIPNPLNPSFVNVPPYQGRREKTIVSVGRLEPQKNHTMLIEAFATVHNQFPDYKLIIYGEGSLRESLERQIKELNLEKYVELPGEVDNIKDKIYKSALFVLSSNYEGMPNALMEAMALGLPCISTDCPCGGPRELINDGENGWLVPCGDVSKLSEKIGTFLAGDFKLQPVKSRETMLCYKADKIMDKWREVVLARDGWNG